MLESDFELAARLDLELTDRLDSETLEIAEDLLLVCVLETDEDRALVVDNALAVLEARAKLLAAKDFSAEEIETPDSESSVDSFVASPPQPVIIKAIRTMDRVRILEAPSFINFFVVPTYKEEKF